MRKLFLLNLKVKGIFEIFYQKLFEKKNSTLAVDVIITLHPKDNKILKDCLKGIKKNLMHSIRKIYIITKNSNKIKSLINEFDCIFVNEKSVLDLEKNQINYRPNNIDRSGWLYQQLLNYSGVISLGECEYKFCINADTILARQQKFFKNNKVVFNACDDYHYDYFDIAKKLLNIKKTSLFSFTSHSMLYKKSVMLDMLKLIEINFKTKWYLAILENVNKNLHSCHSDFETYAQYFYNYHKKSMIIEYWFNKTVFKDTKILNYFNHLMYKSISLHSWAKNR